MVRSSWTGALFVFSGSVVVAAVGGLLALEFPLHAVYLTVFGAIYGAVVLAVAACAVGGALAVERVHRLVRRAVPPATLPRAIARPRRAAA